MSKLSVELATDPNGPDCEVGIRKCSSPRYFAAFGRCMSERLLGIFFKSRLMHLQRQYRTLPVKGKPVRLEV